MDPDRPKPREPRRDDPFRVDPFIPDRLTKPIRMGARQKRAAWLVGIALAIFAIVAALVATLLQKPRALRSTVKADLSQLDSRTWAVTSCLGGPGARPDGADLAQRIHERSLQQPDWPHQMRSCLQSAGQLLTAASRVAAAASGSRLTSAVRYQYRTVIEAASELHQAVTVLTRAARRKRRVPSWSSCTAVADAVARLQRALGRVERAAGLSGPRALPSPRNPKVPGSLKPHPLIGRLALGANMRLHRLGGHRPGRSFILADPSRRTPSRLVVHPVVQGQTWPLKAPALPKDAPPTGPIHWLALVSAGSADTPPDLYWARSQYDVRRKRGVVLTGHTGTTARPVALTWPRQRGLAAKPVAGRTMGKFRLLLLAAPHGLSSQLALVVSQDSGKTYARPLVLADDLRTGSRVRVHTDGSLSNTLVLYPRHPTGLTLIRLDKDGKPVSRTVLAREPSPEPGALRRVGDAAYLVDDSGQLWVHSAAGQPFREVALWKDRKVPSTGRTRIAALQKRVAVVHTPDNGRTTYWRCNPMGCSQPVQLFWSRLDAVGLVVTVEADRQDVHLVARSGRWLLHWHDRGATGKPGTPHLVARLGPRPERYTVVRGTKAHTLGILLLGNGLKLLRSTDSGKTWQGQ